jgi:hypothetical protein
VYAAASFADNRLDDFTPSNIDTWREASENRLRNSSEKCPT